MATQQLHQVLNAVWAVVAEANRYFAVVITEQNTVRQLASALRKGWYHTGASSHQRSFRPSH